MKKAKVSPKLAQDVLDRANGQCEIEGCNSSACHKHHIIRRVAVADEDNIIVLCWSHHQGTRGVHGRDGHALDLKLKIDLQAKYFAQYKTESEVRELMGGMLYFEEGEV